MAAATVATTLAACGGGDSGGGGGGGGSEENEASDIGITEDTIKLGAHYPLTGVAAPGYSEIPTGVEAYFDYVNANGGVNGRQIEFVYRDDAYNPTNTSQIVNQLVLEDEVFAIMSGLGTPTHNAVTDFLNSENVPDLFVSSGSRLWDDVEEKPYTFGWQPDYEIEGKIIGQYVAENFPDAKVGLFLQGDDFGEDGAAGARQYLEDQIVAEETYVPGNTDVVPQISALQAAGADLVLGFNVPSYTALSQLTALRLGYQPQWFYSNVGSDPALVGSLLARFSEGAVSDASLLDGVLTTEYIPGLDAPDNPWVQLWQQVWEESGQEGELTNYRIYGMSQAYTMVQALQSAGQNPTRDDLVAAVEQAGSEWEGPGFTPFRYSEDRHAGYSGMLVSRLQGEGSEDLTPILVTDNGDAEIEELDGEPASPPENGIPEEEPIN
ncbi:ABC-type branched-chain amino acid transport system, substrate-binding protein [Geodermatophilus nigrescens]|uniref:ABC-type branched-chain amino acid transport system, substrate-binding protein n=1 Tax=Geodermatophilus nigrescens TaxID=1070870 RepID=A0A1M5D8T8_9ACTN|nr:ABC-type branched-chain amino acid transport system, substrate-binding protein [Geodermatophilus nigrescens]